MIYVVLSLEQDMPLTPVDNRLDIQTRAIVGERNALRVRAAQDTAANFECGVQGARLHYSDGISRLG